MIAMVTLAAQLQEQADALTEIGLPTTIDPGAIPLPGAWLVLRRLSDFRLDGSSCVAHCLLYLVAGDYAVPDVLDKLTELVELVPGVLGYGDIEAVTLAMPNYAPAGLPALAVPVDLDVTLNTIGE